MSSYSRCIILMFVGLSLSLSLFPSIASAESIYSFDSSISISKNASVHVTETITYDFGNEQRHGIFRKIPTVKTNADGKRFRSSLTVTSVTLNGSNVSFDTSKTAEGIDIKIGDPDTTITGVNTYTVSYDITGPVQYFSDHDELYWNVTGNGWDVPMYEVSSHITIQGAGSELLKGACMTGVEGSTSSDCTVVVEPDVVSFATSRPLYEGEGLTIVASFPKGIVDGIEQKPVTNVLSLLTNPWVQAALFLGYVVLPFCLFVFWWKYGRDPVVDKMVVRTFDPPAHTDGTTMSPVEVGVLVDEVVNPRDISAEIVHLAIKKYIHIKEHPKKLAGFLGGHIEFSRGTALEKNTGLKGLSSHEQRIIKALTLHKSESVKLDDIKQSFATDIQSFQQNVYKEMVGKGMFPRNPQTVRMWWAAGGFVALFTLNILLAAVLFVLSRIMPKKTLAGAEARRQGLGLKSFLESQERQLAFQEKEIFLFEKLLPYAIVFGVAKIWAKRFEHLTTYQPDWYESGSSHSLTSYALVNSLNNNLSTIQSSYVATSTSSSSGFSSGFSGGSSGGGFGGGGGGSW